VRINTELRRYPNLSTLHHFQELQRAACSVAIEDEGEVVCLTLPGKLLLTGVGVDSD
jgi:hypothetical protein